MNWEPIVKKLAKHGLNLLGSAIPGGTVISGIVCDILGCDDNPSAIDEALAKANPETIAKLKEIQLNHKAELQKIVLGNETARIQAVNETMRVEAKSDKWWQSGWRPFWGFASGGVFVFDSMMIGYLQITSDYETLKTLPEFINAKWHMYTIAGAILGITSYGRNKEKLKKLDNFGQ